MHKFILFCTNKLIWSLSISWSKQLYAWQTLLYSHKASGCIRATSKKILQTNWNSFTKNEESFLLTLCLKLEIKLFLYSSKCFPTKFINLASGMMQMVSVHWNKEYSFKWTHLLCKYRHVFYYQGILPLWMHG